MTLPYKEVFFDVSGTCNANCPWCDFGGRKRGFLPPMPDAGTNPFTSPELVEEILRYLLDKSFISQKSSINFYNWGEPLLNPNLEQILLVAYRLGLRSKLSTNGSVKFRVNNPEALKSVAAVIFSVPGYTQKAYDAAHGFDAVAIRRNIKGSVEQLRRMNYSGDIFIAAHIYRTNLDEIAAIREFCISLNCDFAPYIAHPNSMEYYLRFYRNTIDPDICERMLAEIFFMSPADVIKYRPWKYRCPQWSYLTLSWNGSMNLCCASTPQDNELVFVKDITPKESLEMRLQHPTCKECGESGFDYYCHELPVIMRAMIAEGKVPDKLVEFLPPLPTLPVSRWVKRKREISEKGLFAFMKKRLLPK